MRVVDEFLATEDFKWLKNNLLANPYMPYYLCNDQVMSDGQNFFSHTIVSRPDEKTNERQENKVLSDKLYPVIEQLLKDGGETDYEILRANINVSFRSSRDRKIAWHCDHAFDYKHLIFYLTSHDDAPTVIKDDDGNEVVVDAVANRAVFFGRQLHRATLPEYGVRALIVVTYKTLN